MRVRCSLRLLALIRQAKIRADSATFRSSVKGHCAYVQRRLARDRVHLGSAAIPMEPGNYLCIVPAGWGQRHEQLFLPFADEGDTKTSEVISKILLVLLVNDHKI